VWSLAAPVASAGRAIRAGAHQRLMEFDKTVLTAPAGLLRASCCRSGSRSLRASNIGSSCASRAGGYS